MTNNARIARHHRILMLFSQLLFSGKKHYLDDLARQFSCSIEEVREMLEAISSAGVASLETVEVAEWQWVRLSHDLSVEQLMLPADELARLALCCDIFKRLLPDGLGCYIFKLAPDLTLN